MFIMFDFFPRNKSFSPFLQTRENVILLQREEKREKKKGADDVLHFSNWTGTDLIQSWIEFKFLASIVESSYFLSLENKLLKFSLEAAS